MGGGTGKGQDCDGVGRGDESWQKEGGANATGVNDKLPDDVQHTDKTNARNRRAVASFDGNMIAREGDKRGLDMQHKETERRRRTSIRTPELTSPFCI